MRTAAVIMSFVLMVLVSSCAPSRMGMSYYATDGGYQSFYLDVSQYYRVPEREVILLRERNISDEEIPVVFFISQRAGVAPATIINMRMQGLSWMDISLHFGISPEVYYVPVAEVSGGPYEEAYSYYTTRPRTEWSAIRLSDEHIVNFVNLRFVTEHYGYEAPEVMKMRSDGKTFVKISEEIKARKHEREEGRKRGRH